MLQAGLRNAVRQALFLRLKFDFSIGIGLAVFVSILWGKNGLKEFLIAAGIATFAAFLCFCILQVFDKYLSPLSLFRNQEKVKPSKKLRTKKNSPALTPAPSDKTDKQARSLEPIEMSIIPKAWSPRLIESLEWRVFDRLCTSFWRSKGMVVQKHKRNKKNILNFFISSETHPKKGIGIIHCRSSKSGLISVNEMYALLQIKLEYNLQTIIIMHTEKVANVVISFCQSHDIQLISPQNICSGIESLATDKQKELLRTLIKKNYMIPTCPNCRVKMVKKSHRKSKQLVWICKSYPKCQYMMSYTPIFHHK